METLSTVESTGTWAEAVRRTDRRFGSGDDMARSDRCSVRTRPPQFVAVTVARPEFPEFPEFHHSA